MDTTMDTTQLASRVARMIPPDRRHGPRHDARFFAPPQPYEPAGVAGNPVGSIPVQRGRSARTLDDEVRAVEGPCDQDGVRVTLVSPDATLPPLARCLVCHRPLLYGAVVGWVTVKCNHCRLVHRITVEPASDLH